MKKVTTDNNEQQPKASKEVPTDVELAMAITSAKTDIDLAGTCLTDSVNAFGDYLDNIPDIEEGEAGYEERELVETLETEIEDVLEALKEARKTLKRLTRKTTVRMGLMDEGEWK